MHLVKVYSFNTYAKLFEKLTFLTRWSENRNISFSEYFAYVLNEWFLTAYHWKPPIHEVCKRWLFSLKMCTMEPYQALCSVEHISSWIFIKKFLFVLSVHRKTKRQTMRKNTELLHDAMDVTVAIANVFWLKNFIWKLNWKSLQYCLK